MLTSNETKAADWSHKPERSNMLMLSTMRWISLRLGRPIGRLVLYGIAAYFFLFASASRKASRSYLTRVLNRPIRWIDIYKHFFSFASTIHDRIYLLNDRFDIFDIKIHGEQLMLDAMTNNHGIFLIGAHLGSFEVIRALGRHHTDLKVVMAMYEENARKINQMLYAINPEAQQNIIGLGHIDSMLSLNDSLNAGTFVGILGDRTFSNDVTQPIQLLGNIAHIPSGPFRIAAILRRPAIFMVGLYMGGNRYEIHFEKLADFSNCERLERKADIQRAMACYAALLEKHCRHAPYNWFNFFDFWPSLKNEIKQDK